MSENVGDEPLEATLSVRDALDDRLQLALIERTLRSASRVEIDRNGNGGGNCGCCCCCSCGLTSNEIGSVLPISEDEAGASLEDGQVTRTAGSSQSGDPMPTTPVLVFAAGMLALVVAATAPTAGTAVDDDDDDAGDSDEDEDDDAFPRLRVGRANSGCLRFMCRSIFDFNVKPAVQ